MRRHRSTRSGRGCLRWSCLGCIGLVLAPVVIGLALLLVGWLLGRPDPEPKRVDETRGLPSIAAAPSGVEPQADHENRPGRRAAAPRGRLRRSDVRAAPGADR